MVTFTVSQSFNEPLPTHTTLVGLRMADAMVRPMVLLTVSLVKLPVAPVTAKLARVPTKFPPY